jgi:hypothetical protein
MKWFKFLALAAVVAAAAALGVSRLRPGAGRQYYGAWQHSARGYSFSVYHYRPDAGDPAFRTNYAIHYPTTPQYVYFFNPVKGTYWGRFDVKSKGYSLLAEKDRAGLLKDIPESAFPAEGPLPQVPDAKDKLTLAEPPDLPAGEKVDSAPAAGDKTDDLTTAAQGAEKTPPAGPKQEKPARAEPSASPATAGAVAAEAVSPAPSAGDVAPTADPTVPGSGCKRQFGGCHGHGYGW